MSILLTNFTFIIAAIDPEHAPGCHLDRAWERFCERETILRAWSGSRAWNVLKHDIPFWEVINQHVITITSTIIIVIIIIVTIIIIIIIIVIVNWY